MGLVQDQGQDQLAQLWNNIFPWADLNAKSPPERYLTLGKDVLPSLAVLATGIGASGPRLLSTDSLGRLSTLANPSGVDIVRADLAQNQNALQVGDQTLFPIGSMILVASPNGPFRHRVFSWSAGNIINIIPSSFEGYGSGIQVIGESAVSADPRFRITDTETWQTSTIPANQFVDAGLTGVLNVASARILGVQAHFTCAATTAFELFIGNANAAIFKTLWKGQLFGGTDRDYQAFFPFPLALEAFLALTDSIHIFVRVDTAGPDCRGTLYVDSLFRS